MAESMEELNVDDDDADKNDSDGGGDAGGERKSRRAPASRAGRIRRTHSGHQSDKRSSAEAKPVSRRSGSARQRSTSRDRDDEVDGE